MNRAEMILHIDAVADDVRNRFIGDASRTTEYLAAESEALSFKAAGCAGDPPPMVYSWVVAKNLTPQLAADDIIANGAAWRQIMTAIRHIRLVSKEGIRSLPEVEETEEDNNAIAIYTDAITQLKSFLQYVS